MSEEQLFAIVFGAVCAKLVRQHQHELRGSFWIVLVAGRDATNASYQQLEDEWLRLQNALYPALMLRLVRFFIRIYQCTLSRFFVCCAVLIPAADLRRPVRHIF